MEYPCIVFSQRADVGAPSFCLFEAPVSEVIEWSTIPRLSPDHLDGIQRPKSDNRVRAIKSFLQGDVRNTIPTAIVITLSNGTYRLEQSNGEGRQIVIDASQKNNIFVVDGQHRLHGLDDFNPATRVPIVAILNATNEERAFQFVVINNKVAKVAADHIRALTLKFTSDAETPGLDARLKTAKLSLSPNLSYVGLANDLDESPFKGMVSLPSTLEGNRRVVPAAIEASIAYIQSKNIRELASEESAYDMFVLIWSAIKEVWPNTFPNEQKLMSKVGVVSMTRYITDTINTISGYPGSQIDLTNADSVYDAVKNILKTQTEEFWTCEWNLAISDTRNVRDTLQDAMLTIHQNIRYSQPWHASLTFIKPPAE